MYATLLVVGLATLLAVAVAEVRSGGEGEHDAVEADHAGGATPDPPSSRIEHQGAERDPASEAATHSPPVRGNHQRADGYHPGDAVTLSSSVGGEHEGAAEHPGYEAPATPASAAHDAHQ